MEFLHGLVVPLEFFARAGGGGSSSGGGGLGNIFVVLGYVPMHLMTAAFRRQFKQRPALFVPLSIVSWLVFALYAGVLITFMGILGWYTAIAALLGVVAGLYGLFTKLRQSTAVKNELQQAAAEDPIWNEAQLIDFTEAAFKRYQADWGTFNTSAIQQYTTPEYYQHTALLLRVLQSMGRADSMEDIHISAVEVIAMDDEPGSDHDSFTAGITARAKDRLFETQGDKTLYVDYNEFTEFWQFVRSGNTWLLAGIQQQTASLAAENAAIATLAQQNGYYYSLDMGWLFIPKRGQLFGGARFGTSDINNHIVGLYNNQLLVQVYSYNKAPQDTGSKTYVIAQVNVPKQYGTIIVRRKKFMQLPAFGLKRVETEWTQFNKKYEVFASAPEQVTSFELLNPTYMEQLEALPFEVTIEVVDNVIYLYAAESNTDTQTYQTMLDLVNKAFKELRL